jgi:hypothetical protein
MKPAPRNGSTRPPSRSQSRGTGLVSIHAMHEEQVGGQKELMVAPPTWRQEPAPFVRPRGCVQEVDGTVLHFRVRCGAVASFGSGSGCVVAGSGSGTVQDIDRRIGLRTGSSMFAAILIQR